MTARTSFENVTSRFCNHFSIIPSSLACKMCTNYPGIVSRWRLEEQIENISSSAHVVQSTAKQVISQGTANIRVIFIEL